jgi:hypothetical protein
MARQRSGEAEAEAVHTTEAAVEATATAGVGTLGFVALSEEGLLHFSFVMTRPGERRKRSTYLKPKKKQQEKDDLSTMQRA